MGLLMALWPVFWIAAAVVAGYMANTNARGFRPLAWEQIAVPG